MTRPVGSRPSYVLHCRVEGEALPRGADLAIPLLWLVHVGPAQVDRFKRVDLPPPRRACGGELRACGGEKARDILPLRLGGGPRLSSASLNARRTIRSAKRNISPSLRPPLLGGVWVGVPLILLSTRAHFLRASLTHSASAGADAGPENYISSANLESMRLRFSLSPRSLPF